MNPAAQTPLNSTAGNPLAGLHDIHLPASPSLWPPAPGWWLVLALCLFAGAIFILWWWRKHRWHKYILSRIKAEINKPGTDLSQQLAGLSAILRRVALKRYPREQVASLYGEDWLDFLQKTSHDKHFDRDIIQLLAEGLYQAKPDSTLLTNDAPLVQFIVNWVEENLS